MNTRPLSIAALLLALVLPFGCADRGERGEAAKGVEKATGVEQATGAEQSQATQGIVRGETAGDAGETVNAGDSGSAVSNAPGEPDADPIVVVLSWDGMRHDFPDLGEFPGLRRVEREGARAGRLTPVFPSNTFPTHVSMATGTHPDRHGIVDNVFLDPDRGRYAYDADANWIEAEPLWIAAQRQGVDTATYFWVGSESDWRGLGTRYRVAPFDGDRPESVKVDQILEWLALPEGERPRLIMSYWAGADSIGHDEGPNGRGIAAQIRAQDLQLVRLLEGIDALELWPRLSLILVSDHGMAVATDYLDIRGALADAGIKARVLGGAVAQVHLEEPADDALVRSTLDEFFAEVPGSSYYKREELPAPYRLRRDTRLGDWVLLVPPPYTLYEVSASQRALINAATLMGKELGMHGYDPQHPDMGGIFFAMGRSVPKALPAEVRQIDLAATVAKLLAIEPPQHSEGEAIW